jgi:AbrB family looped-hinge helix DNA binding protein
MKVTVKGQVTIPPAIRERYGLTPGTEVELVPQGEVLQVKPRKAKNKKESPFERWLAKAAGSAQVGTSTDEFMKLTRGED